MQGFSAARRADWAPRLSEYLVGIAGRKFRPGVLDCALFAAGAVEAMTGKDPAADYRGKYREIEAGRAMLRAAGFVDHVAFASIMFREIAPAFAVPGDIVAALGDGDGDGAALGILQGPNAFFLRPAGLVTVSRLSIEKAFRV